MEDQWSMNQGRNFKNGKQQIIQQGFKSGREGFRGILGSNTFMDDVIQQDSANTQAKMQSFNDNLAQYGSQYQTLKEETKSYIDKSKLDQSVDKNYNVFINRSKGPNDIQATSQKQCVTKDSIRNLTLATGFDDAYPQNFTNYNDANNACKLWAADTGKTVYAVTKDAAGKYQCSTGTGLVPNIMTNMKPSSMYTVVKGSSTTRIGGLFANGQIGVWSEDTIIAMNNPNWNLISGKKPMKIKKFNKNEYEDPADKSYYQRPFMPAIVNEWWGNSNPPLPSSPDPNMLGVNMFPESIAWWTGNLTGANFNVPDNYNFAAIDGSRSYFYYLYYARIAMRVFLYAVSPVLFGLKINGIDQTMTAFNGNPIYGFTLSVNLPAGKNVFELSAATGIPNSAFVFYAATADKSKVLFKSGDGGWGVTNNPVPDYRVITRVNVDPANLYGVRTINPVPTENDNCDVFMGGGINRGSVSASFGRNCSDTTLKALEIRYIKVMPRTTGTKYGDKFLQISQIVVNAYVNGVITNVADRGKVTAAISWQYLRRGVSDAAEELVKNLPIDGNLKIRAYPNIYHSGFDGADVFWQLDLGQDYLVHEIVYYNATTGQDRANGAKIILTSNNGTVYQPIVLSGGAIQPLKISPTTVGTVMK
jgi:hypothetical protein